MALKPVLGLNRQNTSINGNSNITSGIFPARVRLAIINNATHKNYFKDFGEWDSIGSIFFDDINMPGNGKVDTNNFARPFFSNEKSYPLEGEIVYITQFPGPNFQNDKNDVRFYYLQSVNYWNSNHHNAVPDLLLSQNQDFNNQNDYEATGKGFVNNTSETPQEVSLGKTFKEKDNIKNTQAFEGDIIHEGRWGQSLRFGSTVNNSDTPNPWSTKGENGDPIIILKTSQHEDTSSPKEAPQVENINKDKSSIYLTSTQNIKINSATQNKDKEFNSYVTPPISMGTFSGEQIILNSGRIALNAKSDSTLISSQKSINLNTNESVNIDTKDTIVNSETVLLGGKDAEESIMLGDKFLDSFSKLLDSLTEVSIALQTPIGTPVPGVPNPSILKPAVKLNQEVIKIKGQIESFKSKISKTK